MESSNENKSCRHIAAFNFLSSISLDGTLSELQTDNEIHADNVSLDITNDICNITTKFEVLQSTLEGYPKRCGIPNQNQNRIAKISESSINRFKLENPSELISADTISDLFNIINEPVINEKKYQYSKKIKPSSRRKQKLLSISSSTDDCDDALQRFLKHWNGLSPKQRNATSTESHNERIVLLSSLKNPLVVYSSIQFCKHSQNISTQSDSIDISKEMVNEGCLDSLIMFSNISAGYSISYQHLIEPSKNIIKNTFKTIDGHIADTETGMIIYKTDLLDDPELQSGRHRTLLTFVSYTTSIIDYVNPNELKKELNDKFHELFPWLRLSLTKLRSLKLALYRIAYIECCIDLWTIAQSFVFFERLILMNYITKANRKQVAAACLILSCKMNDIKQLNIYELIQELEDEFKTTKPEIFTYECGSLIALQFALHTSDKLIIPHYKRLIAYS